MCVSQTAPTHGRAAAATPLPTRWTSVRRCGCRTGRWTSSPGRAWWQRWAAGAAGRTPPARLPQLPAAFCSPPAPAPRPLLRPAPCARLQRSADALGALWSRGYFRQPEPHRLAFREFGTTLGVQVGAERWTCMRACAGSGPMPCRRLGVSQPSPCRLSDPPPGQPRRGPRVGRPRGRPARLLGAAPVYARQRWGRKSGVGRLGALHNPQARAAEVSRLLP